MSYYLLLYTWSTPFRLLMSSKFAESLKIVRSRLEFFMTIKCTISASFTLPSRPFDHP